MPTQQHLVLEFIILLKQDKIRIFYLNFKKDWRVHIEFLYLIMTELRFSSDVGMPRQDSSITSGGGA